MPSLEVSGLKGSLHRGIYSHVTPAMTARITNSLQARWQATHSPGQRRSHLHAA